MASRFLLFVPAYGDSSSTILQSPALWVRFPRERIIERDSSEGFAHTRDGEPIRSQLLIRSCKEGEEPVVKPTGHSAQPYGMHVERNSKDVHRVVRRIRDNDMAAITYCDTVIDDLKARINGARIRRAEVVEEAWKRGERIPVYDIEPQGDEPRLVT